MDLQLEGKVALVVAASQGLGKAIALQLAREGVRIAICARHQAQLDRAGAQIEAAAGLRVLALPADVSEPRAAEELVSATVGEFGRLDILVMNAGGPSPGRFLDLAVADWEAATNLILMSAVRLCYAAVPIMQNQAAGSILAMTSVTVKQPLPNLILSNSLRMAVTGMVKTLADELAVFKIRVNAICPGWTRTARVDQLLCDRAARSGTAHEQEAAAVGATIPLGRMGTPEEFAAAAAFLVSPAASYITGVSLLVDGGLYRGVL